MDLYLSLFAAVIVFVFFYRLVWKRLTCERPLLAADLTEESDGNLCNEKVTREKIRYHLKVLGKDKESHKTFIDHLSASLNLVQDASEDQSDVIIAFGTIVSRAGTDIAEMLQYIPDIKPVVLVVFHHTFNPSCVVPDSRRIVSMSNVFTVDCLFHEDRGLLPCQRNNEAEKAVVEFLSKIKRRSKLRKLMA